ISEIILVASTGFCVLRCLQNVDRKYVFQFCQSPAFIENLVMHATGASYPAVTSTIVKECIIPLPPLNKQRKIAAVLDKVSDLIAKRRQQLDKLDELVQARFVEMFGDPRINNLGMELMPMTELCNIIDGDRGKNYPTQDEFSDEGYCLFLNAKNVTTNGFDFENCMFITKEKDELLRKGHLNRGDIVLTTRGTIGNLAFYDNSVSYENIRINSGMVILRMNHDLVSEHFFIEQFKMQLSLIKEKIASGSAQPQLPISTMNKIMMLVPSIELQNQFAAFVEQTEKTKTTISRSLEKLETLKKALMQEYFGV
ncbi:restriction endonuclease subunit S, partial [Negativibacillus massiliensis]|uniref:restriction endonuclease subunit S n=1 Tax=Negativibacillus massiliensis TaxID=1871035 RepID=UPI002A82C17A